MPRKIYRAIQTPITFQDSGGSYTLTLQNLGTSSGRLSAQVDRGAGALPMRYKWKGVIQWANNPVLADYVEILLGESEGILAPDANIGTSDVAMTANDAGNLDRIGLVRAQAATGSVDNIASGAFVITDRYFQIGVLNRSTTIGLRNVANVSLVIITPMPDEIQA
jgi:hypothetical protein